MKTLLVFQLFICCSIVLILGIFASETFAQSPTTAASPTSGAGTGRYNVSLRAPDGYAVQGNTINPAASGDSTSSPNSVTFDVPPSPRTVNFCITNSVSWYQTETGDVRFNQISDSVPVGLVASNSNPPSIFFSSTSTSLFGAGRASAQNWTVNREYDLNDNGESNAGSASFSFYKAQLSREGLSPETLPGCALTSGFGCLNDNGSNSGFYINEGNLTINDPSTFQITAGEKVVILVNGNVLINKPIAVPANSLFILAAAGDITIAPSVGNAIADATPANATLQGIYTAESGNGAAGNIIIQGQSSCPTTPDLRLNVSGTLIANAQQPFGSGGTGTIINNRSLCSLDKTTPSLKVFQRLGFIALLTDLQKTKSRRWSEVAP